MNDTEGYATAVVRVLREHVPNCLTDPVAVAQVARAVEQQACSPQDSFECIVDDPGSARWRLRGASENRSRVRLHYCPVVRPGADRWHELECTVNDTLRALEADR